MFIYSILLTKIFSLFWLSTLNDLSKKTKFEKEINI